MSALDQRSRPSCSQHRDGAGLLGTVLLLFSPPPLVQSCVSRLNPQTSVKITVSVSISNLYPGCEHVSVRSRSMMFEPGLTRGTLEVLVAPLQHPHCAADDQSTKAIDIQNAYLNSTVARSLHGSPSRFPPPGQESSP